MRGAREVLLLDNCDEVLELANFHLGSTSSGATERRPILAGSSSFVPVQIFTRSHSVSAWIRHREPAWVDDAVNMAQSDGRSVGPAAASASAVVSPRLSTSASNAAAQLS